MQEVGEFDMHVPTALQRTTYCAECDEHSLPYSCTVNCRRARGLGVSDVPRSACRCEGEWGGEKAQPHWKRKTWPVHTHCERSAEQSYPVNGLACVYVHDIVCIQYHKMLKGWPRCNNVGKLVQ